MKFNIQTKILNIDASSKNLSAEDSSTLIHPVTFQELASLDLSMSPGWMKETMTCNEDIIVQLFAYNYRQTRRASSRNFERHFVLLNKLKSVHTVNLRS